MNFMYHEELANNLLKLINKKGIINIGGPKQTVYNFAKKTSSKVKPVSAKKILGNKFPLNQSMNIDKYLKPCFINPITVTAINIKRAIIKVTIM